MVRRSVILKSGGRLTVVAWCYLIAALALASSSGVAAQVTVKLEDPTFAEGNFALLGGDVAVEGDFALASAPGAKELHFYTRSVTNGVWSNGITIALDTAHSLGWPVALGDDLAIYYAVRPSGASEEIEVRERYIGVGGTVDNLVFAIDSNVGLPDSLEVEGDLLIASWRPQVGRSSGFWAYERFGETWLSAFGFVNEFTSIGYAVDTDGTRFAVSDPTVGSHGAVYVYTKGPVRGTMAWIAQGLEYSNPVQGNVHFGSSVALEGSCLAVGMQDFDAGSFAVPGSIVPDTGGVQMYALYPFGVGWEAKQALVPEGALEGDHFGTEVSLLGHNLLIAGEDAQRTNATTPGDVSYYRLGGRCFDGKWSEIHRLRSAPLVFDPNANGAYGAAVGMTQNAGILVFDPLGPTGELSGRGYAFEGVVALFADSFESGNLSAWSATSP